MVVLIKYEGKFYDVGAPLCKEACGALGVLGIMEKDGIIGPVFRGAILHQIGYCMALNGVEQQPQPEEPYLDWGAVINSMASEPVLKGNWQRLYGFLISKKQPPLFSTI